MPFATLVFRLHAVQRMLERDISVEHVKEVLRLGKVIENYPEDTPFPSYLMLSWVLHRAIHLVAADNRGGNATIIITAYQPEPEHWDKTFERRKQI